MFIPSGPVVRRVIALYLAGTRGGPVRLKILGLIQAHPRNINDIAAKLGLDYKTVQHHMRVLEKSGMVVSTKKKYDNAYGLSELLKANVLMLAELTKDVGKR